VTLFFTSAATWTWRSAAIRWIYPKARTNRRSAYAAFLDRSGKFQLPSAPRRTIYGYIDRADLVEVLNTFDFASPDMPIGQTLRNHCSRNSRSS